LLSEPGFRDGETGDDALLRRFVEAAAGAHRLRAIMDLVVNHTANGVLIAHRSDLFVHDTGTELSRSA